MDEIVTERSGSILRVQLNRPTKRNAMTSAMYLSLAHIFDKPAVLWQRFALRAVRRRSAWPQQRERRGRAHLEAYE
jgi:hypothetical protein